MAVTWSPTKLLTGAAMAGLSNGNLTAQLSTVTFMATVGKQSGKWYWELDTTAASVHTNYSVGVSALQHDQSLLNWNLSYGVGWRGDSAIVNQSTTRISAVTVGASPVGCIVGIALDATLKRVWFARNNVWVMSGDPANNVNPAVDAVAHSWFLGSLFYPACSPLYSTTAIFDVANFIYSPPSGFSALTEPSDWDGVDRGRAQTLLLRADTQYGGAYRITGTVTELGVAGRYRVRLFDRASARCLRETWSAADGSYSFPYIAYRANGYFTVAYDHGDSPLNAAIADLITPEPMP